MVDCAKLSIKGATLGRIAGLLSAFACVLLFSVPLYAQASVAGVVRDTSGAVLPGVLVEASSDVLIEKVRSAVSDGTGQYRVVDLRAGMYTVTFRWPGFATVKREGTSTGPGWTSRTIYYGRVELGRRTGTVRTVAELATLPDRLEGTVRAFEEEWLV